MKYLLILSLMISAEALAQQVNSPNNRVKLHITFDTALSYQVYYNDTLVVARSIVDMILSDGRKLSDEKRISKSVRRSVNETIVSPVPEKRKYIPDVYNEVKVSFPSAFAVTFRVYNDGVAYRISSSMKDSIVVRNEVAEFSFPPALLLYSEVQGGRTDRFHTSFEENYYQKPLDSITGKNLLFNPVVIMGSPKIAIAESDVDDYPGMFLTGTGSHSLKGTFAPYPKTLKAVMAEYSQIVVAEREKFI
jgi:alpha-glucosidase